MDEFESTKLRNRELAKGEAYSRMASEALSRRDAREYASLCNHYGIPVEDQLLYEQGCAELEIEKAQGSNLEMLARDLGGTDRDFVANLARVSLRNLPLLDRGERFCLREIRQRLKEIEKAGYPLKGGWNKLGKKETWAYFSKVRGEIRNQARKYCAEVLGEIDRINYIEREEGIKIR